MVSIMTATDSMTAMTSLCRRGDGELLTACADGLENNGDGLTDLDDSSCYGPSDLSEATERAYGPFSVTTVAAGAAGQFAYILDRSRDVLLVFERIDGAWVEVDIPGLEATVPELNYTDFETGQAESLDAIVRSALPGPALQGERGIHLLGAQGLSLSSSRLRGELWSRIISTGSVSLDETTWTPTAAQSTVLRGAVLSLMVMMSWPYSCPPWIASAAD